MRSALNFGNCLLALLLLPLLSAMAQESGEPDGPAKAETPGVEGFLKAIQPEEGKMAGAPPRKAQAAVAAAFEQGAPLVQALLEQVGTRPLHETHADYALHTLVVASRAEPYSQHRPMLVEMLSAALESTIPMRAKGFLLTQLQLLAEPEAIPAVKPLLNDPRLAMDAALVLAGIGGEEAASALLEALPDLPAADGEEAAVKTAAILNALADVPHPAAAPKLLAFLENGSRDQKIAAGAALAAGGDPQHAEALLKAAANAGGRILKSELFSSYLALADRIAARSGGKDAMAIYRRALEDETTEPQQQALALAGLGRAGGAEAVPVLIEHLEDEEERVRKAAEAVLIDPENKEAGAGILAMVQESEPKQQMRILKIIGLRGDPAALDTLRQMIAHADAEVSAAAVAAARRIDAGSIADVLIKQLAGADRKVREEAEQALVETAGDGVNRQLAAAFPEAQPQAQTAILKILARRIATDQVETAVDALRSGDEEVRLQAMQTVAGIGTAEHLPLLLEQHRGMKDEKGRKTAADALGVLGRRAADAGKATGYVVEEMRGTDEVRRADLVAVLGRIEGPEALRIVRAMVESTEAAPREAAVRTLTKWSSDEVLDDLQKVAQQEKQTKLHVLALRSFIDRVRDSNELSDEGKDEKAGAALQMARRPEEKQLVISLLAKLRSREALRLLIPLLQDSQSAGAAARAVVEVADEQREEHPELAREALEKATGAAKDEKTKKKAAEILKKLKPTEETQPAEENKEAGSAGPDLEEELHSS